MFVVVPVASRELHSVQGIRSRDTHPVPGRSVVTSDMQRVVGRRFGLALVVARPIDGHTQHMIRNTDDDYDDNTIAHSMLLSVTHVNGHHRYVRK